MPRRGRCSATSSSGAPGVKLLKPRSEGAQTRAVPKQPVAKTGDIIVGMVDGEATVKRLVTAPGYLILKPESKDKTHRQIVVGGDFRVAGKVTHVLKKGSGLLREIFDEGDNS